MSVVLRCILSLAVSVRHNEELLRTALTLPAVTSSGAKLEAIDQILTILPGHAGGKEDPRSTPYELQPCVGERSEAIFLRHGDVISSSQATGSLTCIWNEYEVQVNSSEDGVKDVSNGDGVAETPEEDTEDEDLDNTITAVKATQSISQPHAATPQLSHQHSIVVQETPTTARTRGEANYPTNMGVAQPKLSHTAPIATPEPEEQVGPEQAEPEPYSTARTRHSQEDGMQDDDTAETEDSALVGVIAGEVEDTVEDIQETPNKPHPRVLISKKRRSPAPESDTEPTSRRKRAKIASSENDTQDSRLSTIAVNTSPAIAPAVKSKSRKRTSAIKEVEQNEHPSRSQRSTTTPTAEPYEGDTPCVATSNSTITDTSHAAKFLKKQGGSLVDSVKEPFNVLW